MGAFPLNAWLVLCRTMIDRETILIIDDSRTIRRMVGSSLRSMGYEVIEAEDGIEGLEKLAMSYVDLVIVDLNMPNMDGLEFTRQVRGQNMFVDLPIIMLTTEAGDDQRARGFEAGVNTYLVKPVTMHMLDYKMRALLDARSTRS